MLIFSSLQIILLIIVVATSLFLGFVVYKSNTKSITNILYAWLSGAMSIWLILNFFSIQPDNLSNSLWLIRFSIFFAAPISLLFFLLANTIPSEKFNIEKKYRLLLGLFTLISMLLAISPYAFKTIIIVSNQPQPQSGPGLLPFAILSTFCSIAAVYSLIKKYKQSQGSEKEQLKFMMMGILIMLGLIIMTIFLPAALFKSNFFVPFLPVYTLVFLGMTAYAIVKHHLFNLKVIATEALTSILWIVLFSRIFVDQTLNQKIVDFFIFIGTAFFGVLLIKSVRKEVEQREQLEILTKELGEANEKLKALDIARSEFITIASHQLRTPPATIKWYLAALLSGDYGKFKKDQMEILEKTSRTNNSLISLIDDMLNVSRIERGKMEFLFEEVDLLPLADTTFEQLSPIAQEKKLKLSFERPKTALPKIMADKEKLRQVMNNLIENSIKYTKEGAVKVKLWQDGDEIKFSVTDTGKGVTPEEKTAIFEKFSRGKESIKHSAGLGLGLYVAKIVIEQHKGKIWMESPGANQGSSFIFSLPIHSDLKTTTLFDLANKI